MEKPGIRMTMDGTLVGGRFRQGQGNPGPTIGVLDENWTAHLLPRHRHGSACDAWGESRQLSPLRNGEQKGLLRNNTHSECPSSGGLGYNKSLEIVRGFTWGSKAELGTWRFGFR